MLRLNPSEVESILLVCCGQGFNKTYQASYNRYKVLINGKPIEEMFSKEELKNLAYWVNRAKVMAMSIWGMSQEFEAKVNLGYFLGWYYDESYKPKMDWPDYCKLLDQKIKAVY